MWAIRVPGASGSMLGRPAAIWASRGGPSPVSVKATALPPPRAGCRSFHLLPGICMRYEDGELTTTPLWPWPMNDRIKEARALAGRPVVDVTATIEALLGPIPAACRTGGGGGLTLTVSPTSVAAGGTVTATWANMPSPTATDWLGLYTPGASNAAFLAWRYTTGTRLVAMCRL